MKKILLPTALLFAVTLCAQVDKPIDMPYYDFPMVQKDHYEVVAQNCLTCHSFGYVLNQGKKSRAYWSGVVKKMTDEFKAPIPRDDAQVIVNYLVNNYGNGK